MTRESTWPTITEMFVSIYVQHRELRSPGESHAAGGAYVWELKVRRRGQEQEFLQPTLSLTLPAPVRFRLLAPLIHSPDFGKHEM
ncbi:hypothetical protein CEXT_645461 [Caerostris extrusa]|uniref:Uncharacterized protein n=1 Tax=Caerostris extrusa TaxID=172846 RepID=A0AAV4XX08_CAEEX|nr:hypothetical protein CEXT_645461 [Caerostris extrusa]